MQSLDSNYWDSQYSLGLTPWRGDYNYIRLVLEPYVSDLQKGTALDLGCGSGEYLKWLKDSGWQVEGIDFSKTAVKMANELLGEQVCYEYDLNNLQNYPFKQTGYDLILDNYVLSFIKDKLKYLKIVSEKLNLDGIFLLRCALRHPKNIAVDQNTLEKDLNQFFYVESSIAETAEGKFASYKCKKRAS